MIPDHTRLSDPRPRPEPQRQAQHLPPTGSLRVVAFCQTPGSPLDENIAALIGRGAHVAVTPLHHLPLDWFDRFANSYDMALVDADFLGDKFAMIDFGMRLRRYSPDLPILMLSSQVAESDHSTERMAFCDVTLRLPVSETDLFDSLVTALENHAYWQDSRRDARISRRPPPAEA